MSGPSNNVAVIGDTVELRCARADKSCDGVKWDHMTLDLNRTWYSYSVRKENQTVDDQLHSRYLASVAGDECSLRIDKVETWDAGLHRCRQNVDDFGLESCLNVLGKV